MQDGKLTIEELKPLVKKVFEQVKVELTEVRVELKTELSKELKGNRRKSMLLEILMGSTEMLIDMEGFIMDEGIADPTEPAQELFKKLGIDKCVRECHLVHCSLVVGTKDTCSRYQGRLPARPLAGASVPCLPVLLRC